MTCHQCTANTSQTYLVLLDSQVTVDCHLTIGRCVGCEVQGWISEKGVQDMNAKCGPLQEVRGAIIIVKIEVLRKLWNLQHSKAQSVCRNISLFISFVCAPDIGRIRSLP